MIIPIKATMVAKSKVQQQQLGAAFFPCAARVSMPQLGRDESDMHQRVRKPTTTMLSLKPPPVDDTPVDRKYLQQISSDLVFDQAVVKERCFHMMPYDSKYLAEALDVSDILPGRQQGTTVRQPRGAVPRHAPCGLRLTKPTTLKPMKRKIAQRALAMSSAAQREAEDVSSQSVTSSQYEQLKPDKKVADVFLTELGEEGEQKPNVPETLQRLQDKIKQLKEEAEAEEEERHPVRGRKEGSQKDWDTFLMSRLSRMTATWIVHERMSPDQKRTEMMKTLHGWYGKPKHVDLVEEKGSEEEDNTDFDVFKKDKKEKPSKKWKKKESTLLERVYSSKAVDTEPVANDPYSDDNEAPFYRQPAGIRRQKKHFDKEEAEDLETKESKQEEMINSAINATAHRIKVKSTKEPKPPTLRDFMPPGVGSTLLDTDNQYQQELLTGVGHVYQKGGDGTLIVMDSDHKYKKVLRPDFPDAPEKWYPPTEKEKKQRAGSPKSIKREFKSQRWRALPEPYDDTFEAQKVVPPGFDAGSHRPIDPAATKQVNQNQTLMKILHDWRAKWSLSGQFADASYDDIIKDMADIQPHVRLKAIATIGKAAEYKPPADPGIKLGSEAFVNDTPLKDIPHRVFVALEYLLDDSNQLVQRSAAVTLYALECPCPKAEEILRQTLKSEVAADKWTAAQCLAHFGVCDSRVVDEIIKQILGSEEPIKHEQGIVLLAKISNSTTLVHSMVAEQLNSSSWRHRVIACKILPALYGTINKDVTHKLTDLMWHDWHKEVRQAAAQCLGKTSHGRDVHDDIRRAIMYGNERIKLEAISRLGQLGIMTAKLLPAFLQCFSSQYVAIRTECCITCSNLRIQDEQVVEKLVHLATFDPIWKVKALAIQALGMVGVVNDTIKDCLLWALRYEEKAGVRAEACHSLVALDILDEDVVDCLQDRLLVESSQVVRDEMIEALQNVGLNASEDLDTVAQIKMEVRKLCNRNVIASQIVLNEVDQLRQENLENMMFISQEEAKRLQLPKRNFYLNMASMSQYDYHIGLQRKQSRLMDKEEQRKETALQRLRGMKSASEESTPPQVPATRQPSSESVLTAGTPEPVTSREATLFTPSADKELEAILNRADVASEPSGESISKSRPVTGETVTSGTYTSPETTSPVSRPSIHEEVAEEAERVPSAAAAPSLLTPLSRSRLGISPSASRNEAKLSGSQMSIHLSGRRTVVSRDTIREREKMDQHVSCTYLGLSARYIDMLSELGKIDSGLSVGPLSRDSKRSKFLTIPGDLAPQESASAPGRLEVDTASAALGASEDPEPTAPSEASGEKAEDTQEKENGQVAVSLEVPFTESQMNVSSSDMVLNSKEDKEDEDGQVTLEVSATDGQAGTTGDGLMYSSDEGKGDDDGQSVQYSTDYPSLGEDVAPSYMDDSICGNEVAPSTYGESTTYQAGQASEYEHSLLSDIENESTLD